MRERRLRPLLPLAGRLGKEGRGAAAAAKRGRRPGKSLGQREEQALSGSVSVRRKVLLRPDTLSMVNNGHLMVASWRLYTVMRVLVAISKLLKNMSGHLG